MDERVDAASAELLRATERRRLRALVERDMDVARSLHSDDYQLITPGGAALSKDAYLAEIASGALAYEVFEPASDIAVRLWVDAAALRYRARIEVVFSSTRDAGTFWHTDLYQRGDGRWQVVWSHATRIR